MNLTKQEYQGQMVALVESDTPLITDTQSALDLLMSACFETGARKLAINKAALAAEFFQLKSGLAGEVVQKFVNYNLQLAIYGSFEAEQAASKALHDYIYESNRGNALFFAEDLDQALAMLCRA